MALEDTAIWSEVQTVMGSKTAYKYYHWTLQILANGANYNSMKVISIDLDRNYETGYSDKVMVTAMFPKGSFEHLIMPYKDNLLCTLKGSPIGDISTQVNTSAPLPTQQMRGTLVDTGSKVMEGNDPYVQDLISANISGLSVVRIQMVDLVLEQARMKGMGAIYRNTTPGNALRVSMLNALKDLKLPADQAIKGIDMVKEDNITSRDHVHIPAKRSFMEIPDHIHYNCGGIYSTGFGFYLQNAMFYIYPSYNIKRYNQAKKTATFINLPKNRFPQAERTYRTTPNQLIVLITGGTASVDHTESLILNKGNGIRYTDANNVLEGPGQASNNVYQIQRSKNNSEYVGEKRSTGFNNAPVSDQDITVNGYVQMSKMALQGGRHMQATWENSDPSLITPGMPCKYVYLVNDQVMESEGIILRAQTYSHMQGKGLTDDRHVSKTVVTMLIDKSVPWADDEPQVDTSVMTSTSTPTNA
ncbi:MAG TPA: hypothetical protein VN081_05110 [Dongiaceae bacterium]|nr:hypothetical protein [Dongiaceae bacterium]